MKVTRLQKIRGYRIFRDFTWPADGLLEFAQFNVIYGWNGTGKTTLSSLFRHIQNGTPMPEGEAEVVIDTTKISSADFPTAVLPAIRVFNRDAVDRNIFESTDQQLPPVFFFGEDSVEKQKRIEELRLELSLQISNEADGTLKLSTAKSAMDSFCAEEAKGIKNLLTLPGGGPYNNYNASNFKADIRNLISSNYIPLALTIDEKNQYLFTKDGKALDRVEPPSVKFPDFVGLATRTQAMLEQSIVSAVIDELTESPEIAMWVSAGLPLHQGKNVTQKCHFCDQLIPQKRIQQLEAHFNDEFRHFQQRVDLLMLEVRNTKDFGISFQLPPKQALYSILQPEYEKAIESIKSQTHVLNSVLEVLLRALEAKRNEPFKRMDLLNFVTNFSTNEEPVGDFEKFFQRLAGGAAVLSAAIGKTAFDQLLRVISQHNQRTDSFDKEATKARQALAQDEILKSLSEWRKFSDAINEAERQVASAHEKSAQLKTEITELEVQVRQHRRPAEELNEEIAAYLGRDELRFDVEQNGYRITRGGYPATHLSDGERTAITFLYFLKSLEGTDFDLKSGIVVIDDPVSSLDANSLYSAFGFMKQRTAEVGQLFVMTHNFTFFRQVRNWYYNLPGQRKKDFSQQPARFYMLGTEFNNGERNSKLAPLDPFLHQYESEYHYLFSRVYEEANKVVAPNLEPYYAIPNIARRLLESFLAFRVPDKPSELFQKLECINYDAAKKTRILRFLHTYSHFDQVADAGHDLSVLSETPAILKEMMALIAASDPQHYTDMVALVSSSHHHV